MDNAAPAVLRDINGNKCGYDKGFWIGALLSVPLGVFSGVCSIFAYNWLMRQLEQRKLTKANETRQQAIRTYKLITAFRRGTKDKYTYYLLCVGWAAICAVMSGNTTILLVLINST